MNAGDPLVECELTAIDAGAGGGLVVSSARDSEICALYARGVTLKAIGARFGLSYEGVRKIAAKYGLNKRNAGLAIRKRSVPRHNRAEEACRQIYGCSLESLVAISPEERAAFLQHRKNVRRKAIEWRLSLNEWRALWRVSGRWSERGRGPAKYGMTRVDFNQAVEPGNVEIMTNREAVRRARLRVPVPPATISSSRRGNV